MFLTSFVQNLLYLKHALHCPACARFLLLPRNPLLSPLSVYSCRNPYKPPNNVLKRESGHLTWFWSPVFSSSFVAFTESILSKHIYELLSWLLSLMNRPAYSVKSVRFWGFQPNLPISGRKKLTHITRLTIAMRRWHMRCEGCRAAFLGPFACRADRLSCMVKAASQRETLPPPGWCWESRIKIAVAIGVFLGSWNYGVWHIILCIYSQKL